MEHLMVKLGNRDGGTVEQPWWNSTTCDGGTVEKWNNHGGTVDYLIVEQKNI